MKTQSARHETGHFARLDFTRFTDAQLRAYLATCACHEDFFSDDYKAARLELRQRDIQSI